MSNEKDIAEKTLQSFNDVFADIVNALLFQGEQVIAEDELVQARARSGYTGENSLREQERDEAKFWKKENIRIAFLGLENETEEDADMPIRVIGYDGAAYRDQLYYEKDTDGKRRKNTNRRFPVVTLVLYFGTKRWHAPLTLYENLGEIDQEMKPYINNYRINLFEIAWLTDEQLKYFHSDFRFVAEFFVKKRKNEEYLGTEEEIIHVKELLDLMRYLTKDSRYQEIYQEACENGKEIHAMCEVLDRIEERGKKIGEEIGRETAKKEAAIGLFAADVSLEKIAAGLKEPVEVIRSWVLPEKQ